MMTNSNDVDQPQFDDLSDLLLNSPFAGANLDLERSKDYPRQVDLGSVRTLKDGFLAAYFRWIDRPLPAGRRWLRNVRERDGHCPQSIH